MSELGDDLEELRSMLESVVDRLDDLAFKELRHAVARGDQKRPEIERRMTRARNAVIRALGLLASDTAEEAD